MIILLLLDRRLLSSYLSPATKIILVRQYRHGAGEILLELPAGTFNG